MSYNYTNNAYSVLDGAISNSATSIQLAAGTGSRFPSSNFKATLIGYDVSGNENAWEIVLCSSRTGDILTVTRGQEGTTAVAWANGARIENRLTAGTFDTLEPAIAAGTAAQYWRGDKSWSDFFTDVRAATLTGLSTATSAIISATDTVLGALGKLQAQISGITAVSGLLKSNGTTVSAATANTDYLPVNSPSMTGNVSIGGTATVAGHVLAVTGNAVMRGDATEGGQVSFMDKTNSATPLVVDVNVNGHGRVFTQVNNAALMIGQISGTGGDVVFYAEAAERARFNAAGRFDVKTGLTETRTTMGANDINLLTGNYFTKTISGATTLTVSNIPASGLAASFILDLTNGGSATITWFSGVKWVSGTAPTLTAAGRDVLGFFTHDGGTTWTGLLLGKDVK